MREAPEALVTDPLVSEQSAEAQATGEQEAAEPLPKTSSGREFTVVQLNGNDNAIVEGVGGAMFPVQLGENMKVNVGDKLRVSWSEVDDSDHPLNAKATSVKS